MKHVIELNLHSSSDFFLGLKKSFLAHTFGATNFSESQVDAIVSAVIKTLKEELGSQGKPATGDIKYVLEKEAHVYPDFFEAMTHHIDAAMNYRIHQTTTERCIDHVIDFMKEEAKKQKKARTIKVPKLIDANHELNCIMGYVTNTWDGFDKLDAPKFFAQVWSTCMQRTRHQFDEYIFLDLVEKWQKQRQDFFNWQQAGTLMNREEVDDALDNDKIYKLSMYILLGSSKLHRLLRENWDYGENVDQIMAQVKKDFPAVVTLKPKGWEELASNYCDFDGMEELDGRAARKAFLGMDSGGAGHHSFEVRVALPHVMYDDKCQGRPPLEVLVGAMLGHAYILNQRNNASKMLAEFVDMKHEYDKPQYYRVPVTELKWDFKQPLNQALICFCPLNDEVLENPGEQAANILGLQGNKGGSRKKKTLA